ncbi:MAG TPA: PH domain-containing protein [Phycisphaerales bacterium]|nr:PH domain-containing protein [Phycisphaerales bacterium]
MGNQYRVHGRDGETVVTKVFEAETGDGARAMAEAIGLEVIAIEVVREEGLKSAPVGDPLGGSVHIDSGRAPLGPEEPIWEDSPSQWINFWWYLSCLLVLPIPLAIWKGIVVSRTDYSVSTQRLRCETGVFNRDLEEIELYRIKDTKLLRSFLQRLLRRGTIVVLSSDESLPTLVIPWIKDAHEVREMIRQNVEKVRRARGVRELDVN